MAYLPLFFQEYDVIINKVSVGLEPRRKCRPGCDSTVPRQRPRDPVGEFLLIGPHATGLSFAVAWIRLRIGNTVAGHPTRRDALWRIIQASPRIIIPPS